MIKEKSLKNQKTIPAGYTVDYVSGKQVKETKKERVRQRVARALIHEYGFSPEDMELSFSIGGRKKWISPYSTTAKSTRLKTLEGP